MMRLAKYVISLLFLTSFALATPYHATIKFEKNHLTTRYWGGVASLRFIRGMAPEEIAIQSLTGNRIDNINIGKVLLAHKNRGRVAATLIQKNNKNWELFLHTKRYTLNIQGRGNRVHKVSRMLRSILAGKLLDGPEGNPVISHITGDPIVAATTSSISLAPVLMASTINTFKMALDVDYEYYEYFKDQADPFGALGAHLGSIISRAAAIYWRDLGFGIDVVGAVVATTLPQPYTAGNPDDLIVEYRDYRNENPFPTDSVVNTNYLFSGKNHGTPTIGIAYRQTACETGFNYALTAVDPNSDAVFGYLVLAHETGHQFNAEHTGTAGSIMNPSLSFSDTTFVGESIAQMSAYLAGFPACLTPSTGFVPPSPDATATPIPTEGNDGPLVGLTISARKSRDSKTVTFSITPNGDATSCDVTLYGKTSATAATRVTLKSGVPLAGAAIKYRATNLPTRLTKTGRLYFAVSAICSEDAVESTVKNISYTGGRSGLSPSKMLARIRRYLGLAQK